MYTKKGDFGTSTTLRSKQRLFKCADLFEALGSVDELNALLGLCKVKAAILVSNEINLKNIIHSLQEQLFTVQAELAGADFSLNEDAVDNCESLIADIAKILPPITSFFIPGGSELSALLDYARTVCRRAERSIIKAETSHEITVGENTKQFINRLSSVLYALTRWVNYQNEVTEIGPSYTNATKN